MPLKSRPAGTPSTGSRDKVTPAVEEVVSNTNLFVSQASNANRIKKTTYPLAKYITCNVSKGSINTSNSINASSSGSHSLSQKPTEIYVSNRDVTIEGSNASPDGTNVTQSTFKHGINVSHAEASVVSMIVADSLFPEVKFADKYTMLNYDENEKSICNFILTKANYSGPTINRVDWWNTMRSVVLSTLSQLRNDRSTAMKYAYHSKYFGNQELGFSYCLRFFY